MSDEKTEPKVQAELDAMLVELTEARRQGRAIPIKLVPPRNQTYEPPKRADGRRVIGWLCRHHAGYGIIRPKRMQTLPLGSRKVAVRDMGTVLAPSWSIIGRILAEIDTPPEACTAEADARLLVDVICDALLDGASGLLSRNVMERCKAMRIIACAWDLDDKRTALAHDYMIALIERVEARLGADATSLENWRPASNASTPAPVGDDRDWIYSSQTDYGKAMHGLRGKRARLFETDLASGMLAEYDPNNGDPRYVIAEKRKHAEVKAKVSKMQAEKWNRQPRPPKTVS